MKASLWTYGKLMLFYWGLAYLGLYPIWIAVAMGQMLWMMSSLALFAQEETVEEIPDESDENETNTKKIITIPERTTNDVKGRYLFALCISVMGTLGNLGFLLWQDLVLDKDLLLPVLTLFATLALGGLLLDIALPLFYSLGATRGKPWFFLLTLTPVALVALGVFGAKGRGEEIFADINFLRLFAGLLLGVALALAFGIFSCKLSLHLLWQRENIVKNKEKTLQN